MRFVHVIRRLRQSPMFTLTTVVTLALGIGANAAIFSVLQGVLLKPLPYADPESLISVNHAAPGVEIPKAGISPFLYLTYRDQSRTLEDIGMYNSDDVSVTGLAEPEQILALNVTQSVLPILGVQPALGRLFSRQDDTPGSPRTALISHGYWQRRFGANPSAVGRRILVGGNAVEIIGVLPASFRFLDRNVDLFRPLQWDRGKTLLGNFSFDALARLKPGVAMATVNADLTRLIPVAIDAFPPFPGGNKAMFHEARLSPILLPLKQELVGDIGKALWVLMGTIGVVLIIACANVANLLLLRTEGRQHELAIRLALGAGWQQIAGALILESVTLAALGGAAGLGLAYGAIRLLVAIAPANLPRLSEIAVDGRVMLFTAAVSLAAALLFGAAPAWKYAGPHVAQTLRAGGRSLSQSRERHRARSVLVVVQVGLALLLLIGSGLMIRTFQALRNVQPGFTNPEQLQTLHVDIPGSQVKDAVQATRMQQSILDKIAAIPGVESAAYTSRIPLGGSGWHDPIYAEDHAYAEGKLPPVLTYKFFSPGMVKTMGGTLVTGREFTWTDLYEQRRVAMVSENLARELWHEPSAAIGKRIRGITKDEWREIVGVTADERTDGVDQKPPATAIWPALTANFGGNKTFVFRSVAIVIRSRRTGTSGFLDEVRRAVWSVNPNLPLYNVRTMEELYRKSLARTSFTLVMLAIAGAMALLLGVIGIYGVISYSVSQRAREIGIRMALGSPRGEITRMFVAHGLRLAGVGTVCGLGAALACTRLMKSLLFEISPLDPMTFAGVPLVLVAAAMAASYLPALRAALVDPVESLRAE
jgi:predicted permease